MAMANETTDSSDDDDFMITVGDLITSLQELNMPHLLISIACKSPACKSSPVTHMPFTVERHGDERVVLIPARDLHY